MNVMGIAMALLLFWAMLSVGIVLTLKGAIGLVPYEVRIDLIAGTRNQSRTTVLQETVNKVFLAVGLLLTYVGGSSVFNVLFQ